jgi:hypothetical protein
MKGLRTANLAAGSRPAGRATRGSAIAGETGSTKAPRTRAERRAAASRKRGPSRTRARRHGVDAAMAQLDQAGMTRRGARRKREIDRAATGDRTGRTVGQARPAGDSRLRQRYQQATDR